MENVNGKYKRLLLSSCILGALVLTPAAYSNVQASASYEEATYSAPIALSGNNKLLWAVNQDTDTVSVIRTDTNQLVAKIAVGDEPRSVALSPDDKYAYVANAIGNSVTVIKIKNAKPNKFKAVVAKIFGKNGHIVTGSEPVGVVMSPDGRRLFVANSSQDTISVINAKNRKTIGSVDLRNSLCNLGSKKRHFQPRGMAVSADNKHLYVTRFLSYTHDSGVQREDDGKEGVVCRLDINTKSKSIASYAPANAISLQPSDTGLLDKNGDQTLAFPNQMQSIVLRDGRAYLPNIGASPTGPQRFDTNTQAYVNVIDDIGEDDIDAGAINLHLGGRDPENGKEELYFANPWAMAFTTNEGEGDAYVVSAGSDMLVKLNVDEDGELDFTVDSDTTRYIDLNDPDDPATSNENAGKNPVGIAINKNTQKAYVLNYISRNVSVVNLQTDAVEAVIKTEDLPAPGSQEEVLLVGAEMFFSSRGNFVRPEGAFGSSRNRLSDKGRQNCASCHAHGLTDGIIWQFASGPRKTIAVNGTFNPKNPVDQRIINATAVFDEVEDADFNTRLVSSAGLLDVATECRSFPASAENLESKNDPDHGLILGEEGDFEFAPCVMNPFAKPNTNRPQPEVQLPGSDVKVRAHDALIDWQRYSVRTPNRPMTKRELKRAGASPVGGLSDRDIKKGRKLFAQANCQSCHGGGQWTKSRKDFVSPPDPAEISTEIGVPGANPAQVLHRFLNDIGSYNLNVASSGNEIPGYPQIGGIEKDTNGLDALGFDYNGDGKGSGFNTPSLLGAYNIQPFYHNGACETLDCVLADVNHRRAGLAPGQADPIDTPKKLKQLERYLESIDESSELHPLN